MPATATAAPRGFPYRDHRAVSAFEPTPPPQPGGTAMTGFLAPRGAPPVLQNLSLSQLAIDPAYQRAIDGPGRKLISEIARAWDWSLCQPLVVARRPGGELFVIDGQHRLAGARARGDIPWLPCVVVDHATPAGEAASFVALNARRRPLTPMALFRADVASGNPAAIEVQHLVEAAGLRLTGAADTDAWKPGWVNHIAAIVKTHRQHGERVTRLALEALAAGFDGEVLRLCGLLWAGIAPTIVAAGEDYVGFILTEVLRDADQEKWRRDIMQIAADRGLSRHGAAAAAMLAAYREAEGEE